MKFPKTLSDWFRGKYLVGLMWERRKHDSLFHTEPTCGGNLIQFGKVFVMI